MQTRNLKLCNITTLLSFLLVIYILVTSYIEYSYIEDNIGSNIFYMKMILLGLLFVVMSLFISFFKFYKKSYVEKEVVQRTENILKENSSLKTNSNIDSLTKCINKKYFFERYKEEFKRAIREKQTISLLIINIDEFKAYNDIYGRNEGDECLKIVANILVNHCNRPTDIVSRFKPDEYYVLLPNTSEPQAVATKCLKSVRSLNIPHENSIASNILTISIGISTISPTDTKEEESFIETTKEALKIAKKTGRNRIYFL